MAFDEVDAAVDPFMQAAGTGNLELLKSKVRNSDHRTALHFAASRGQTRVCKYLIEELKMDVNVQEGKGDTPLHAATICEQYLTVVHLLKVGANPNCVNCIHQTPLHHAAQLGLKDIVILLIERGAEVDAKAFSGLGTPVSLAAANGDKDALIARLKFQASGRGDPKYVSRGIKPLTSADYQNTFADLCITPLIAAILYHKFACMEALLQAGADPNFESHGYRPLRFAVIRGRTEAIKLLLKYGANANSTLVDGMTLLEMAAMTGSFEKCEVLFPVTNQILNISDWTLNGVLNYCISEDALSRLVAKRKEKFANSKLRADASFKKEDYLDAVFGYSEALEAEENDAAVLSNRSLCWAKLKEGDQALIDAKACIKVKPDWPKAHYRAGVAYTLLQDYVKAGDAFSDALKLDPDNKEIQEALRKL